jgi:hypothetical protein
MRRTGHMREYPKGPLTKRDYENLLSMPEYEKQAKEDLVRLAAIDDSKVAVDVGTSEKSKLEIIDNPLPAWKRAGFKDRTELGVLAKL